MHDTFGVAGDGGHCCPVRATPRLERERTLADGRGVLGTPHVAQHRHRTVRVRPIGLLAASIHSCHSAENVGVVVAEVEVVTHRPPLPSHEDLNHPRQAAGDVYPILYGFG